MIDAVVLDPNAFTQGKGWTVEWLFSTDITVTRSGAEQRIQRWLLGRRQWTIPYESMSMAQLLELRQFFLLRGGSARGFLLWDVVDSYVGTPSLIGVGSGAQTVFQLGINHTDGVNTVFEPVLHPVPAGTTIPVNLLGAIGWTSTNLTTFNTIHVNGVAKTEGTDYTVNTSTGAITFTVAPPVTALITWQGWRYMAVRFDGDTFSVEMTNILGESNPKLIEVKGE